MMQDPETETVVHDVAPLDRLDRAEIDLQIATARRYPRVLSAALKRARELALLDQETAESMYYTIPREGKLIEGPSVRLAEIVAACWGNLRVGARPVLLDERYVTARGMALDLESNYAVSVDVRRRITDRHGRRYSDDMIGVTTNAACAIAYRQAVFKVIPGAYIKPIYEAAKLAAVGHGTLTLDKQRDRALAWYAKLGASVKQVCQLVRKSALEDLTSEDIVILRGIATAIKDGEITLDEALRQVDAAPTVVRPESLTPEAVLAGTASGVNNAPPPGESAAPPSPGPASPDPARRRPRSRIPVALDPPPGPPAEAEPGDPAPGPEPALGPTWTSEEEITSERVADLIASSDQEDALDALADRLYGSSVFRGWPEATRRIVRAAIARRRRELAGL